LRYRIGVKIGNAAAPSQLLKAPTAGMRKTPTVPRMTSTAASQAYAFMP
jgi:hypothetical protein